MNEQSITSVDLGARRCGAGWYRLLEIRYGNGVCRNSLSTDIAKVILWRGGYCLYIVVRNVVTIFWSRGGLERERGGCRELRRQEQRPFTSIREVITEIITATLDLF